jgi:hypothetical protein
MPTYDGRAANIDGAPLRRGLHSHRFVGVEVPSTPEVLADPVLRASAEADVEALLAGAASIELTGPTSARWGATTPFSLRVQSLVEGHDLPTGSTFNRQMWIAIEAEDGDGRTATVMGGVDPAGDVAHWPGSITGTDADGNVELIAFGSVLRDASGLPVPFTWRAERVVANTLDPLEARGFACRLDAPTLGERWTLTARLLFRSLDPALLRALELDTETSRAAVELARSAWSVTLSGGAAIDNPLAGEDEDPDPPEREDGRLDGTWTAARCRPE